MKKIFREIYGAGIYFLLFEISDGYWLSSSNFSCRLSEILGYGIGSCGFLIGPGYLIFQIQLLWTYIWENIEV